MEVARKIATKNPQMWTYDLAKCANWVFLVLHGTLVRRQMYTYFSKASLMEYQMSTNETRERDGV